MHFLFEIFYTLYPYLWQFTMGAISILFIGLEVFSPAIIEAPMGAPTTIDLIGLRVYVGLYAGLGVLGMLFVLHLLSNALSRASARVSKERGAKKLEHLWFPKHWQVFGLSVWALYSLLFYRLFYPRTEYVFSIVDNLAESMSIFMTFFMILGIGFLVYLLVRGGWQLIWLLVPRLAKNHWLRRVFLFTTFSAAVLPFVLLAILLIELFIDPLKEHDSVTNWATYSVVHAAIKNTCLGDPSRENCPHSLEEISYIEPSEYENMMKNAQQVLYRYDAETNHYTLIVRYTPGLAAVYDQRLIELYGIDVHEYPVAVLGQDRLMDAPDFVLSQGLEVFSEWEY